MLCCVVSGGKCLCVVVWGMVVISYGFLCGEL